MTRRALLLACVLAATRPAWAGWATGSQREVDLDGDGTGWMVRATINGRVRARFLLDTGASFCVLSPSLAKQLKLPPPEAEVDLQTANGMVRAPLVRLGTLEVGGSRAYDVDAVVHAAVGPPLDGIIGLNFLNKFSYGIDPRRRVLRLQ